jgi:hypothetical protein
VETKQQRIERRREHLERARAQAKPHAAPKPISSTVTNHTAHPAAGIGNAGVQRHTNIGQQFPNQTAGTHFSSHPSPEFVIPGLSQHAERLNAGDVEVLHRAVQVMSRRRGAAIIASAELLLSRGQCSNHLQAVLLAAELLEDEPEAVCEILATLIEDGWEGGFAAALRAARSL